MKSLADITSIKHKVMARLIKTNTIVDAMNFNHKEKLKGDKLLYSQIFPYFYVPMSNTENNTSTEAKPFITMRTYVPRVRNNILENYILQIAVFSHKLAMRYNSRIMTDYLIDEVNKVILDIDKLGIDSAKLVAIDPYPPQIPSYDGYILTYEIDVLQRKCE